MSTDKRNDCGDTSVLDSVVTLGDIARAVGQLEHRVRYILRTRGVQPLRKVAGTYVYAASVVDLVREAGARIDSKSKAVTS